MWKLIFKFNTSVFVTSSLKNSRIKYLISIIIIFKYTQTLKELYMDLTKFHKNSDVDNNRHKSGEI